MSAIEGHGRDVLTAPVKYVFLDVVGFTRNRSIEAQAEIIDRINEIVRECIAAVHLDPDRAILLPTGDGICIAMVGVEALFDIHMKVALGILQRIQEHNERTADDMRRFVVRAGINENVDNLIIDINGNRNVAGTGINFAQRIMSLADGGQVLVGQPVFETLRQRERYLNAFRSYSAVAKHNTFLPVYQLISPHPGLNVQEPTAFVKTVEAQVRLTKAAAYYFAHSIRHREVLLQYIDRPYGAFVAVVLLWLLANDSVGYSEATEINPYKPHAWGAGKMSLAEQFEYYINQDLWLCVILSRFVQDHHLASYGRFFDADQGTWSTVFVNTEGMKKLQSEWPVIWRDFEFEYYDI